MYHMYYIHYIYTYSLHSYSPLGGVAIIKKHKKAPQGNLAFFLFFFYNNLPKFLGKFTIGNKVHNYPPKGCKMVYFNSSSCHCMELKNMNTSVQIKTHTNHSASIRNVENLRESEQFKNPHIEVLQKTPDYKFQDDVTPPVARADVKSEKARQDELRKVNNKINTYSKRLKVFQEQNNTKKIESLTKQIEDLKIQKEQLKEQKTAPETRGKKREKNYIEFIFALTKSNQYIDNIDMQNVLKRAFERIKKTKVIKQLEGITGAMHLDQYSLHIHYLAKVPDGKTWDNIVNGGFKDNPEKTKKENAKEKKKISAKTYKNIQDTFQKFVKEEILKSNLENKHRLIHFSHLKGEKYLPLKKYKALNPLENEKVEEIIKEDLKELVEAPINLEDRIEQIKDKYIPKNEVPLLEKDENLEKLIENMEAKTEIESVSSILNEKEVQEEEKTTRKKRRNK